MVATKTARTTRRTVGIGLDVTDASMIDGLRYISSIMDNDNGVVDCIILL
jgi:hypothetical protein